MQIIKIDWLTYNVTFSAVQFACNFISEYTVMSGMQGMIHAEQINIQVIHNKKHFSFYVMGFV